jgi:hypothetical protein
VRFAAITLFAALGCALDPSRVGSARDLSDPPGFGLPSAQAEPASVVAENEPDEDAPLTRGRLWAAWNSLRGDTYALDPIDRWIHDGERVTCDRGELVSYRGAVLRYSGAVLVNPAFRERLERFEQVVVEVSREIYGREPVRIRHYGAFSCRPTRNRSRLTSEHALGNALDLVGFDFARATKGKPLPSDVAPELRNSFQVRVGKHWAATKGARAVHARFLSTLTERLRERDDIFRSMFGPGHGGHDDHLHLDVSPWRYVDL